MSESPQLAPELMVPPPQDDPEAQLAQIREVIEVVNSIGHPRVKPLKQKLNQAFARVGQSAEKGVAAEVIAGALTSDLRELRQQTYQLLTVVVNQLRGTLKNQRLTPAERIQAEKLQKGLGLFAKATRKMLDASKKDDPLLRDAAARLMEEAHRALDDAPRG